MLSVPLVWHDEVVGVLNVQTRAVRRFEPTEVDLLQTIAALLAGIVEKGRLTAEVEARLAQLTALDAARSELLSVVTHELRTPLSVVRVYVDLLAEAWGRERGCRRLARGGQRPARQTGSPRRLDPRVGPRRGPHRPVEGTVRRSRRGRRGRRDVASLLRPHPIRWERPDRPMTAIGDETRFRQVLEQLLENESKYAPTEKGVSIGIWRQGDEVQVYVTDDGPGVPVQDWESVFEPFVRWKAGTVARVRDRAVRRPAAHGSDGRPRVPRAERVRRLALRGCPSGQLGVAGPSALDGLAREADLSEEILTGCVQR
jgi:signal transduction histidine kinase